MTGRAAPFEADGAAERAADRPPRLVSTPRTTLPSTARLDWGNYDEEAASGDAFTWRGVESEAFVQRLEARLARNRDELAPERAIWRRARVAPDHVSRHCSAAGGAGDSAVLPATRRTTRTVYRPGFEAAQRKLGRDVADALCKVEIPDDHHRLAPAASLGAAVAAPALPAPHRDVEIFVGCNWEGGKFADSAPRSDASSGSGNATTLDAPGAAIVPGTPSVLDAARDASRREAKWQEHLEALRQEAGSSDSEPDSAVDKPSGQGAFAQHMEAREELLPAGKAYRLAMHSTAAQPRRVWCPCLRC